MYVCGDDFSTKLRCDAPYFFIFRCLVFVPEAELELLHWRCTLQRFDDITRCAGRGRPCLPCIIYRSTTMHFVPLYQHCTVLFCCSRIAADSLPYLYRLPTTHSRVSLAFLAVLSHVRASVSFYLPNAASVLQQLSS